MLQIEYSKKASYTPAFRLLVEGWNEMVQEGWTIENSAVCPITEDHEVLYAVGPDGDVVGVIAWRSLKDRACYVVDLGYVEPSSRRKDVFRSLFQALMERAEKHNVIHVEAPVAVSNKIGSTTMLRLGADATALTMQMQVFA